MGERIIGLFNVMVKWIASLLILVYSKRFPRGDIRINRRDGRVVDGARLESVYTATYRGFESLFLRHLYV